MATAMSANEAWLFLAFGYVATVSIELPILYFGLDRKHSRTDRITAGFLLTALTYPFVILLFPAIFGLVGITSRVVFLLVAEIFAPVAEILFFRFITNRSLLARPDRDAAVIVLANLASFLAGELFLGRFLLRTIRTLTH